MDKIIEELENYPSLPEGFSVADLDKYMADDRVLNFDAKFTSAMDAAQARADKARSKAVDAAAAAKNELGSPPQAQLNRKDQVKAPSQFAVNDGPGQTTPMQLDSESFRSLPPHTAAFLVRSLCLPNTVVVTSDSNQPLIVKHWIAEVAQDNIHSVAVNEIRMDVKQFDNEWSARAYNSGFRQVSASASAGGSNSGWSVSAAVSASYQNSTEFQASEAGNKSFFTGKYEVRKALIGIAKKDITINSYILNEFDDAAKAIQGARKQNSDETELMAALVELLNKYGCFVATTYVLGGMLSTVHSVEGESKKTETFSKFERSFSASIEGGGYGATAGASAAARSGAENNQGSENSNRSGTYTLSAKGGAAGDLNNSTLWFDSLNVENWDVISYDDLVPIYKFMNPETQTIVKDALEYREREKVLSESTDDWFYIFVKDKRGALAIDAKNALKLVEPKPDKNAFTSTGDYQRFVVKSNMISTADKKHYIVAKDIEGTSICVVDSLDGLDKSLYQWIASADGGDIRLAKTNKSIHFESDGNVTLGSAGTLCYPSKYFRVKIVSEVNNSLCISVVGENIILSQSTSSSTNNIFLFDSDHFFEPKSVVVGKSMCLAVVDRIDKTPKIKLAPQGCANCRWEIDRSYIKLVDGRRRCLDVCGNLATGNDIILCGMNSGANQKFIIEILPFEIKL